MAEALANALPGDRFEAFSAGTEPTRVHPDAVMVMSEIGLNLTRSQSKSLDLFIDRNWDYVVTVCDHANEACPLFPGGRKRMHKGFPDPAAVEDEEDRLRAFRKTRDAIRAWIEETFADRAR
jgi:arsenate reductase